jgi:hypothetical protein
MTTGTGGAGKKIGGGRGMLICTLTPAIAETGMKITIVKNNILKINFFIVLPPLLIINPITERNDRNLPFDT